MLEKIRIWLIDATNWLGAFYNTIMVRPILYSGLLLVVTGAIVVVVSPVWIIGPLAHYANLIAFALFCTTVFVCMIAEKEMPVYEPLDTSGGDE